MSDTTGPELDSGPGEASAGQDAWSRLKAARDPEAFATDWLAQQSERVGGGVVCAVVVLGTPDTGPFAPIAVHPTGTLGSPTMVTAIESAIERRELVITTGTRPASQDRAKFRVDVVAYPLVVDEQICGAVGFELEHGEGDALLAATERLQWGSAWVEAFLRRRRYTSSDRLVTVLELITTGLQHDRFQAAATAVATELAGTLGCERVSIGFLRGRHSRVRALSHSASFARKANVVRAIEAAMDEAIDQQATIVHPSAEDGPVRVTRAHEALVRDHGAVHVCTVPMAEGERILGALVLERPAGEPFDDRTVALCEQIGALLGPVLDVKRKDDRLLVLKAGDSFGRYAKKLFGPRHTGLKLISAGVAAVLLFFAVVDGDFRVTADARLEGSIQRAISAPLAGYVAEANFRAGDVVEQGDVLVALDDRDLWLEKLKVGSQKSQYTREYAEAVAMHDRAQAAVLAAQIEQADAELALVDEQLSRIKVTAPFDSFVVNGDLSQSLGAPVERGDILFEVAPLDSYRVILQVDERDVGEVAVGQTGELVLSGTPDDALDIVVDKVTPVATSEEGANFFRIEAHVTSEQDATSMLRPGMEGVGKIYVDERKLIWIWTYKIVHWVRMFFWSWWP